MGYSQDWWHIGGAAEESFSGNLWQLGGTQTVADGRDVTSLNYFQNWSVHARW